MAFTNWYGINVQFDNTQPPEKQWQSVIFYKPSTAASGPTVPTFTTGPLGATGTATVSYTHGDGTAAGWQSPLDTMQRTLLYIAEDRSIGN